ncbi:MAG: hypothetical protein OEV31_00310, partial [Gammaproteobacteria bacterium]|nr:hypothetical protein [Gammaproteobacteria bacterium]
MKPDFWQQWRQLAERIDAMSLRERGIMFVTVLLMLYFVADGMVFGPLRVQQQRLENELRLKYDQIGVLNAQTQQIVHAATRDPDKENGARLEQLRAQIGSLDPRLAQVAQGLVSPREMARLVEQVLTRNRALQVLKVESLPPA